MRTLIALSCLALFATTEISPAVAQSQTGKAFFAAEKKGFASNRERAKQLRGTLNQSNTATASSNKNKKK